MERGARCSVSTRRQVRVSLCLWDDEDLGILDLSPGIRKGVGLRVWRGLCASSRKLYLREGGEQGTSERVRAQMRLGKWPV